MNLILEQLEKSKQNKELLNFTVYNDDSKFWCGYVVDYSEDFVAIQHFTKFGKKDGIIVHPIERLKELILMTITLKQWNALLIIVMKFTNQTQ